MSDRLIPDFPGEWQFDVATAYKSVIITDFSGNFIADVRTIEISQVSSECVNRDHFDIIAKPYRNLKVRLRTWEVIQYVGQGCIIMDATIDLTRRHTPSPQGEYQSGKYASENIRILLQEYFRDGGIFVQPGTQWANANLDGACP